MGSCMCYAGAIRTRLKNWHVYFGKWVHNKKGTALSLSLSLFISAHYSSGYSAYVSTKRTQRLQKTLKSEKESAHVCMNTLRNAACNIYLMYLLSS